MFDNRRDVELMRRIGDGEVGAFEELFGLYKNHMSRFFYHLCWDAERTQDFVQEVFLRLWRSAAAFEGRSRFSTYLFQIAKNLWISEKTRDDRRVRPLPLPEDEDSRDGAGIPDKSPGPRGAALVKELGERIRSAVASLDERKQVVFVLSEFQGLKYQDIADILEIPVGTVKSRMASAERELRARLKGYVTE